MTLIGFDSFYHDIASDLMFSGENVEVPTWQALPTEGLPQGKTVEITDVTIAYEIPHGQEELQRDIKANQPFAEAQFQDRVSGKPLNPPPSHELWPWAHHNPDHQKEEKFSHSYPERFWSKNAKVLAANGVRYPWWTYPNVGDLNDVLALLAEQPTTRQAYLPVFFPHDTGAVHGQRIPCTLGYLFMFRRGQLNITYYIRSCDFLRHMRDDIYMTCRLAQWMTDCLRGQVHEPTHEVWEKAEVGHMTMHIGSLHIFRGDLPQLRKLYEQNHET